MRLHRRLSALSCATTVALAAAAAALTACDRVGGAGRTAAADSVASLTRRLATAEQGMRDRDALMSELANTAKLVNDIDSTLRQVKGVKLKMTATTGDDPWSSRRDSLVARMAGVTRALAQSRARLKALKQQNGALAARVESYEATVAELEATVARQKQELAAYAVTVDSLRQVERQLASARDAARDSLTGTRDTLRTSRDASNRVYYVVGRKRDLIAKHVVSEEGTKRFLVAGRRTLVPARALDASQFAAADQRQPTVINLPEPGEKYRVVSRHDAGLLSAGRTPDGRPDGTLRVTDPERFWSASRYLIIVQN
jgi:conjugal transfer/entry exclusion protein